MSFGFDILYENGPVLGINKPAGLLTQAPPGVDSLEKRVKNYLCVTENRPENGYLGIPHRLDRPVSGVILFGKHSRATHRLSEQFERREIKKTYWTLVAGHVQDDSGTWTDFVRKIPDTPKAEIVTEEHPDAKIAVLHYKVVKRFSIRDIPVTHLEITLETGRMHQIRLQSSFHGHPILGDAAYNSDIPFDENFHDERSRTIALHAVSIAFIDSMTKAPVTLTAPLPETWNMKEL